jgi:hypothetical protein
VAEVLQVEGALLVFGLENVIPLPGPMPEPIMVAAATRPTIAHTVAKRWRS